MKRKGNNCDFLALRAAELRKAFFSQGHYSTCDEVMKKTVKTPTSRFWVDPDRARDVMSLIEKDPRVIDGMHPDKGRMYLALYDKYKTLRRRNPKASKIQCVSMAIYSGAPEFFLAPSTARSILYN